MRRDGFSLLELVAVLAIFAVVALIGVQAIQTTLRSSERLSEVSESSETLAFGLALLRQDLNAALPRTFVPPNGGTEPALLSGASGFSLSVGGLAPLRQDVTSFGRAVWRFERGTGNVYRSVWTTRTPGGGRPTDVLVFDGITAFDLASFTLTAGWQPGFAVDPRNPSVLPLGLRVRMEHERYATLETLVSLR